VRVERSDHQRLPFMDGWLLRAVKFDPVAMDCPSIGGKLWFDQNTFKIRGGFKFIGLKNNGATPVGIIANFSHCGIKARHKECLSWLETFRALCRRDSTLVVRADVPSLKTLLLDPGAGAKFCLRRSQKPDPKTLTDGSH
jgi:hypothetical protein